MLISGLMNLKKFYKHNSFTNGSFLINSNKNDYKSFLKKFCIEYIGHKIYVFFNIQYFAKFF